MKKLMLLFILIILAGCNKDSDEMIKFQNAIEMFEQTSTYGYEYSRTQTYNSTVTNQDKIDLFIDYENLLAEKHIYQKSLNDLQSAELFSEVENILFYHEGRIGQHISEQLVWEVGVFDDFVDFDLPITELISKDFDSFEIVELTNSFEFKGIIKNARNVLGYNLSAQQIELRIAIDDMNRILSIHLKITQEKSIINIDFTLKYEKPIIQIP